MKPIAEQRCIFCQIGQGLVPSEFLYRDDDLFAIRDIHPKAPVHLLIIPFAHVGLLTNERPSHLRALGKLFAAAATLAKRLGLRQNGYRLIINQGAHSGQEVHHLHMHLLAGQPLGPLG